MSEEPQNTTNAPAANEPAAPSEPQSPATDAPAATTAASDGAPATDEAQQETPAGPQLRAFRVDLYQSHWARSLTEQFHVEATDEDAARKQAEEILATKNLAKDENNDWDYEVVEDGTPVSQA